MMDQVLADKSSKKHGVFASLREDVVCVFERDPAARNILEIITTYPGVHALIMHRMAHALWSSGWCYIGRLLAYVSRIWTGIDIHPGATIGRRFFIDHGDGVVIGETAEIGNDVTIYHGVTLGGVSWNQGKRHPTVCDNAVIGAGAKILGPITIGKASRVGANSVVIRSVADGKTVVGIPAKVVNNRATSTAQSHGIDLDHHLMPDPVAGAVACLLDRIRVLEKSLGVHACQDVIGGQEEDCDDCDAVDVCEPNSSALTVALKQAV